MIATTDGNAPSVRVWVAAAPVDMRKSFDGLAEIVRSTLGHDPPSGSLFVFRNKSARCVKILWWDQTGLAIFYKRIERGAFQFPTPHDHVMAIDSAQLMRLISGLELVATRSA